MTSKNVPLPVTATHDDGSKTHFSSMGIAYKYAITHPDVVEINVDLKRDDKPQQPITFCRKQDGYGKDYLVYVPDGDDEIAHNEPTTTKEEKVSTKKPYKVPNYTYDDDGINVHSRHFAGDTPVPRYAKEDGINVYSRYFAGD